MSDFSDSDTKASKVTELIQDQSEGTEISKGPLPLHQQFQLKWKKKHLRFLIIYNVLIPCIIALIILLTTKNIISKSGKSHLALISTLPLLACSLVSYYFYKAYITWKDYKELVKPERLKYLFRGANSASLSFIFMLVALVTSYTVSEEQASNITTWTLFSVSIITGLVSTVFITMYEFCSNFDVFYSKNKEELIKAHLEYTAHAANLKISDSEQNSAEQSELDKENNVDKK